MAERSRPFQDDESARFETKAERRSPRPQREVDGIHPVFIVGPARSGTSLLYKLLCLHPEVTYLSNWVSRFPRYPQLAVLNRLVGAFPDRVKNVWFSGGSNAYVYGNSRPLAQRLYPMPVEGEPVFSTSGLSGLPAVAPDFDLARSRLRLTLRQVCSWSGRTVFVNKRIANNRRIPLLLDVFPSSRFVSIVRDGRAVAHSLAHVDWWEHSVVWWWGDTPERWRESGRDPWEVCARNWVEELRAIDAGLHRVPAERVVRSTYESLVADPSSELSRIAAALRLPASESWLELVAKLRFPDRNELWKTALSPDAIETITTTQRDYLMRYGYLV